MLTPNPEAAVLLFSGGQDSTTCLYWALQRYDQVHAVIFDYGQRHAVEIAQARAIAKLCDVPSLVLPISGLGQLGGSALTDSNVSVADELGTETTLPNTFVPGRNLLFLTLAAGYAYLKGIPNLVTGVCQADYSGYPDCRAAFITSAEASLRLAMDYPFAVHTPLMNLDKAGIWKLASELGCLDIVIQQSHTCYNGDHSTLHAWGYGCGHCPACQLRKRGFEQAFKSA